MAKARSKKNGQLDVSKYKAPKEMMSRNRRAAHFLDWAAVNYPYQYIQYNLLLKAIHGYKRLPRLDSEPVVHVKKGMTGIRKMLYKYHCRLSNTEPGLGVRALVDDTDNLRVALPKQTRRLFGSKLAVERTVGMIDIRRVPNTPELRHYKKWLKDDVIGILRALKGVSFDTRALPPARQDEDEG
jgi:hypothetical protein